MRPTLFPALLGPLRTLIMLAALWAGSLLPAAAAPSAQPLLHCRGSTRAHVGIAWPTPADLRPYRTWGRHIPARIRRWAYLIVPDATANGVDAYLVAGLIQMESNGDPLAWNLDSDARGLMQVLHASFQPRDNVRLGISMLAGWLRQFGNRDLALAAYNAGPGYVQQYGGLPPFPETRDYVVIVDYYRDRDAGLQLSPARTAHYRSALANLIATYRKICGSSLHEADQPGLFTAYGRTAKRAHRARLWEGLRSLVPSGALGSVAQTLHGGPSYGNKNG